MHKILVRGGNKLQGTIAISGAKNAGLAVLPAALLTSSPVVISNVPKIQDIVLMGELLSYNGVTVKMQGQYSMEHASQHSKVVLQADNITAVTAPYDLVRKMRASILVLGPLLARVGKAHVSLPGGCAIGNRPVDLHIEALKQMGAEIEIEHGYIDARAPKRLKGAKIVFDKVSVGATENALMAATLAKGFTELHNAAREPEIIDLAQCLKTMGAKIHGEGTNVITIEGVDELYGAHHKLIGDRIEAGTYAIAAAITEGDLHLKYIDPALIEVPLKHLEECNIQVIRHADGVTIRSKGAIHPTNLQTQPFPDFPTDLQGPMMAFLCRAQGNSQIQETIFENRFMHVPELNRMGANISIHGNVAEIHGHCQFKGAPVMATDLRASVALILAGLAAAAGEETIVNRVYHLDRGYEDLAGKLSNCGANIERVAE